MREILFRGKRTDNSEWVEGDIIHKCEYRLIGQFNDFSEYKSSLVIPESVGQYTGLTDKNDKKIFEGDIIRVDDTENAVVDYDETSAFYMAVFNQAESDFGSLIAQYPNVEVIGNVFDNPELLKSNNES